MALPLCFGFLFPGCEELGVDFALPFGIRLLAQYKFLGRRVVKSICFGLWWGCLWCRSIALWIGITVLDAIASYGRSSTEPATPVTFGSSVHRSTDDWLHGRRGIIWFIIGVGNFCNYITAEGGLYDVYMEEQERRHACIDWGRRNISTKTQPYEQCFHAILSTGTFTLLSWSSLASVSSKEPHV